MNEAPTTPGNHYDPSGTNPAAGPVPQPGDRPTDLKTSGSRPARPPRRDKGGSGIVWLLLLVVAAAAVVGLLAWKRAGEHDKLVAQTKELAVQTVAVIHPGTGPSENEITLPGNVMAYNEASIFARTNGYLKSWSTDIGAPVKEGQIMAEIEAPDVDAQLRQSKATLEQAKSNLEIANLNFDRQKDLLAKKVASQQEFDQNRTNVDAMKAAVQADEANVQNLAVQKNFQQIVAPFAGVVTRRNTDVGALISSSNGGQELFRVARTDILRVYVYVPEAYASYVKVGAKANLDFAEYPRAEIRGQGGQHRGCARPGHPHVANGNPGGQQGQQALPGGVRQRAFVPAAQDGADDCAGEHRAFPQGRHAGRRGGRARRGPPHRCHHWAGLRHESGDHPRIDADRQHRGESFGFAGRRRGSAGGRAEAGVVAGEVIRG